MTNNFNFAPISGAPSLALNFAVAWLRLNGWLGLLLITAGSLLAAFGNGPLRELFGTAPIQIGFQFVVAIGLLVIARDLARRRRRGAYWAVAAFVAPVIPAILGQGSLFVPGIIAVLGVAAIIPAWSELTPEGPVGS